jgi:SNF2-related domain
MITESYSTNWVTRCIFPPGKHQIEGILRLIHEPYFALWDEMGSGKSLQVVVAAQLLFEMNVIDRVVILAPASVRNVWFDPELGEIRKHLFLDMRIWCTEYHSRRRRWENGTLRPDGRILRFVISNYDFVRNSARRAELLKVCSSRTLLVLDESSAVKNPSAKQTKACEEIRGKCGRVVILNGTPISNNPGDLYSQAHLMHPSILNCKNWWVFRSRYGILGGWQGRQVVAWRNVEEIQKLLAPYVLRRLKSQCLDLPEKLDSVPLAVNLTHQTWTVYKQMRDDMVAWLSSDTLASAQQAVVRLLRLSQITSGFVGGVQQGDVDLTSFDGEEQQTPQDLKIGLVQEIGREKLDLFLSWLLERLEEDSNLKILVWCRFRAELERLFVTLSGQEFQTRAGALTLGKIWGGQKRAEREVSLRLLDPRTAPSGPVVVIGTPASGAMGLNLTAAHTVVYLSNDYSLKTRLQSEDRVHRPGQTMSVSYFDVIAEGPHGQKTIDHTILAALKRKDDLAQWTTNAWVRALQEE